MKADVGKEREEQGVLDPMTESNRDWIRICRREIVPGFAQAKISVTTRASGMVVIEPLLDVSTHFWVAKGIAKVLPNQPLWLFVSIFYKEPRSLSKKMVVETALSSPMEMGEVHEKIGRAKKRSVCK